MTDHTKLAAFLDKHGLDTRGIIWAGRYYVVLCQPGVTAYGIGETLEEAIDNYAEMLSGKSLMVDDREIQVPDLH